MEFLGGFTFLVEFVTCCRSGSINGHIKRVILALFEYICICKIEVEGALGISTTIYTYLAGIAIEGETLLQLRYIFTMVLLVILEIVII